MEISFHYLFSISMAITAYSFVSTGFVLMKMGIDWMGWKGKRTKGFYKNLFYWLTGFVIMNIYGIPSALALDRLPSHVVAAFAGWGIVMLVFLSRLLLKEKLLKTDVIFSLLIVAGIVLLNFFQSPSSAGSFTNLAGLFALCAVPVALFFCGFMKRWPAKIRTSIFSSVSGISAGLMVVLLKLLVLNYQYQVALYFSSPYLYLYAGFALLSFVALQLACKNGPMMAIGPVQYSASIIYPLVAALLIFNQWLSITQLLSAGLIVYSVVQILKKR